MSCDSSTILYLIAATRIQDHMVDNILSLLEVHATFLGNNLLGIRGGENALQFNAYPKRVPAACECVPVPTFRR